ncbi:MAG: hypothetical protein H7Y43_08360 [Akkermansiaceae bacterium]|nr:hypothetical protein [Verrucomicrobiales bacterium]
MNDQENPVPASSETTDLRREVADLRRQAITLLLGTAVLSLTFAAFVGLQARRADKDLAIVRPQANQLLDVNKKDAPLIQNFVSQLEAYGKGHPDYANTVLAKYGIKSNGVPTGAIAPGTAPRK